jgi:hypothetical protein
MGRIAARRTRVREPVNQLFMRLFMELSMMMRAMM